MLQAKLESKQRIFEMKKKAQEEKLKANEEKVANKLQLSLP